MNHRTVRNSVALAVGIVFGASVAVVTSSDSSPFAIAVEQPGTIHYEVVAGDTWANIASRYNITTLVLARANNHASVPSAQPITGRILHIVPGAPPVTTTTAAPTTTTTTVAPTTTVAGTTTTVDPTTTTSTTSTTTTTQPPGTTTTTTQPPVGGAFVETFTDDEAWRTRWDVDIHHRDEVNVSLTPWVGDHDLTCSPPDIQRQVSATDHDPGPGIDRSEQVYRCGTDGGVGNAHMMTSIGDVDGYSTISFSPKQAFAQLHKVCWDQNVTDAGGRGWTEVVIVPASKVADGNLNHVNPEFESVDDTEKFHDNSTWGAMIHGQYFGLEVFANGVTSKAGEYYQFGRDVAGQQSRAIRRQHCLFINANNTVTVQVDQGVDGFWTHTYPGVIQANSRVIFEQHAYTPDKDGEACQTRGVLTGCRYTWHWDNLTIE